MGSINWNGKSALGVLGLPFLGSRARLEHTTGGMGGGPPPANPTKSVTYVVDVGAQISGSASIGSVGVDDGGSWERATGGLARRSVNGEPRAREGVAIESGSFDFRPANGRWAQFEFRVGRGRTAGSSDTSAPVSWKVGL